MNKNILALILFFSCLTGFTQEPVEVLVRMKAQCDHTQLCRHRVRRWHSLAGDRRRSRSHFDVH